MTCPLAACLRFCAACEDFATLYHCSRIGGVAQAKSGKFLKILQVERALARALPCVDVGARGVPARARVKSQNQTANPHFLDTVPRNHTSAPPAPPTLNTIPIGYNFTVQEWNYTLTGVKMQIMFDFVPERV